MAYGYNGKILRVDLTSRQISTEEPEEDFYRRYMGGRGFIGYHLLKELQPGIEPLGSDNKLIFATGVITGGRIGGSGRNSVGAKSPLTGGYGEAEAGGYWGAELKRTGYDAIIFEGRSEQPVYLWVGSDGPELRDASHLWGKTTLETETAIREELSDRNIKTALIGPAGENRVKYASVCNDKANYFGRTGMGAVMGSKNLKAILVRGTGKVPIADETAFRRLRSEAVKTIKESLLCESSRAVGTAAAMELGTLLGDVPFKNWSEGGHEDMGDSLGGSALAAEFVLGRKACLTCPIGCKPIVEVSDPTNNVSKGAGPEYETLAAFGAMIMNDDLAAVIKANDLCNRLGLDTITCGSTIAFMMEAYEKRLLSQGVLDGVDLSWGAMDAVLSMIKKIAFREGFGDQAAEGTKILADRLGDCSKDGAIEVKGLELPFHDPRALHGLGLAYMTSNRGACHLQHSDLAVEQGSVSWPEVGLQEEYIPQDSEGKAEMVYITENLGQMGNALCVCHFVHWAMGNQLLLDGFNAVTGYGFEMTDLLQAGRRSWILKRALNNMMGVTSADDRLPKRLLTPLEEGGAEGSVPDTDLMKSEYYSVRGLDDKGCPKPEILRELELDFLETELQR